MHKKRTLMVSAANIRIGLLIAAALWSSPVCLAVQGSDQDVSDRSAPSIAVDAAGIVGKSSSYANGGRRMLSDADHRKHQDEIIPFLESYCADCHLDGGEEGGIVLDDLLNRQLNDDSVKLWDRALAQMRLDLMPPVDMDQPEDAQKNQVSQWVKEAVFQIDPRNPNPGRVVIGRLNRVEYRKTILDLMDYRIDTEHLFPPDDTGHGFDNIGEVLTLSPLLMEKYINAATEIVFAKVPQEAAVAQIRWFAGEQYELRGEGKLDEYKDPRFEYHLGGGANLKFEIPQSGQYRLELILVAAEKYSEGAIDENTAQVKVTCADKVLLDEEFTREDWRYVTLELQRDWVKGEYTLDVEVTPKNVSESTRELRLQIDQTRLVGPLDKPETFTLPEGYTEYFETCALETNDQKRQSAARLLKRFASRAFRRPVSSATLERLVALAESVWTAEGGTFQLGVSQAMVAVLSSPSFIFKETYPESSDDRFPLIDEYSLATRLSYFLWSTMPDERLLKLAEEGKLRQNLDDEVERMISDDRFDAFYKNFIGQWLLTRDVMSVPINAFAVLRREGEGDRERELREQLRAFKSIKGELTNPQNEQRRKIYGQLRKLYKAAEAFELTNSLRKYMRRETEMLFEHLAKTDADLIQLIDCDYTFLNEKLAKHYGIEGVQGRKMRRVELKPDDHRGGLLTQGSLLTVTSNPDRTSPVKRGLFILENILGMPTGAPPPDIPSLEEAGGEAHDKLTLRQSLALHREDPMCSSCHNRMDPLGLALENYDALGRYREHEAGEAVDASGTLITGEDFENVQDLKRILSKNHRAKFYRCLTEKMMTYALGRSVDYNDTQTIDDIVTQLESSGATARSLLKAVVMSPGFQRTAK